jgi:hypothetical protein
MAHKAFVSSTFEDLKGHRQVVLAALRKAGFFVDPMEDWSASTDEPKNFSQDRLEGCDLCILLVGFRRGHVPQGEELSITQLEYQAAIASGIDVLVFMLQEDAPWPRKFDELGKDPGISRFRAELKELRGIGFFGLESTSIEIAPALTRWIREKKVDSKPSASIRREAAARLRAMRGRFSERDFFREIYGLSRGTGEQEHAPSTWALGRLILEGWGEEKALVCRYHEVEQLLLSEDQRKAEGTVAAAEEHLETIIQTLGIAPVASGSRLG